MTEKELKKYSKLREDLLVQKEKALKKTVDSLQRKLLEAIFNSIIDRLETDQGKLKDTSANIKLSAAIDSVYNKFIKEGMLPTAAQMVKDYGDLLGVNRKYFELFAKSKKEFSDISKRVDKLLGKRVGVESNGKLIEGGFLDNFIRDPTLRNQVKQQTMKAITNGMPLNEFIKTIQTTVVGDEKVEGGLQRHFRTFAYDSYSIFDRSVNDGFALNLGLKYAIYAGGIIDDSRDFCIERNNKVFTTDEIAKFGTSSDKYGGYTNKSEGEFQGKSKPYNPFTDLGGYNCRHILNYISKELAFNLRPDLEK